MGYEYLCRHVIPGCSERLEAASQTETMQRVEDHLRDSHEIEQMEDELRTKIEAAVQRTYG